MAGTTDFCPRCGQHRRVDSHWMTCSKCGLHLDDWERYDLAAEAEANPPIAICRDWETALIDGPGPISGGTDG